MNRILTITVLATLIVSLVLGLTIRERALAQSNREDKVAIKSLVLSGTEAFNRHEDEEAIKSLILAWTEASNRHDAKAGTAFFTLDADYVNVFGRWSKGVTEIEKFRKERYDTALKESKITPIDIQIRFIRPDVAIVHELHDFRGMVGPNGEKMPTQRELGIRVLVKEHGKWFVTAFHNTVVRPVESPARKK